MFKHAVLHMIPSVVVNKIDFTNKIEVVVAKSPG